MADGRADLLAVYETREQAEAAARAAERLGVPQASIRVGDARDEAPALEAEMRAEMEAGVVAPQAGVAVPKEQAKASGAAMALGALIGAIVLMPFAAFDFGNLPVAARLLICALVGASAGATGTYVVGAAAARGPADPMAAERGVTVRIGAGDQRVVDALKQTQPIRLDVVGGDDSIDLRPVTAERSGSTTEAVGDAAETLRHPHGDWTGTRENRDR
jgi:hypothetical protein